MQRLFSLLTAIKTKKYREEDPFFFFSNLNARQTRAKQQQSFNVSTVGVIVSFNLYVNKYKLHR
jgi:hypothetical protein